ncbi:MAG: MFS transporter [Deltaproteobacteria bacterium]|nr:MFS transporter [Deltaproteobacteria bacterium]
MQKKSLITIFLVVFIDLVGFGMVIPILPYYAKSYGGSGFTMGLLMMSYSGMQFLFSPFWGRLSDRIGRRPVILTCITGIGASMILLGLAPNLTLLFIARLLAGFFGANISAASAYIADITPPDQRAKGMGLIGAAFGLGFLFGPALVGILGKLGILAKWGYGSVGFMAATLALINLLFAFSSLQEPKLNEEIRKEHRHKGGREVWRNTLASPQRAIPIFLFFLVTFAFSQMETTFALYLLARFHLDAEHASFILALMAVIMVLVQGGAIGRLSKKWGEIKLAQSGTLLMGSGLLLASFAPSLAFFVFFLCLLALGSSLTNPSLSALLSKNSGSDVQGLSMGVFQSAGSLARMFGPPLGGLLFDHYGIQSPFVGAAFLFFVGMGTLFAKQEVFRQK